MNGFAEVIAEAAKSPLGVISLIALLLSSISLRFFKNEHVSVRLAVFMLLIALAAGFGYAAIREDQPNGRVVPPETEPQEDDSLTGPTSTAPPAEDISAITTIVTGQIESRDCTAAWQTVTEALEKLPTSEELLDRQVDVAALCVRNGRPADGEPLDDSLGPQLQALYRATTRKDDENAADAFAHIGWANFLKDRFGSGNHEVEPKYRAALERDPKNPFAHAMWGHWLMTRHAPLAEARAHFEAALESERERAFVREFQIAALQWFDSTENNIEVIRVCNDMRKGGESLSVDSRSRLLGAIYYMDRREIIARLDSILPAEAHLATFRWLLQGMDVEESGINRFFLARLSEAAADCETALPIYVSLIGAGLTEDLEFQKGIDRCKANAPQLGSELEILTRALHHVDAERRRRALTGLSSLAAAGKIRAQDVIRAVVPVLRDPDEFVRAAAEGTLARLGKEALPRTIDLLASADPQDQIAAAKVLARFGPEAKPAVSALLEVVRGSHDDARWAALSALAAIGPGASPAVQPIVERLSTQQSLGDRKLLVYTLGEIGPASKPAVPLIVDALRDQNDPDGFLNVVAADALGKIGPGAAAAIPALVSALDSDNPRLPSAAEVALKAIGPRGRAALDSHTQAARGQEP